MEAAARATTAPLRPSVDRMVEAARQAAVPGSLWLAGILYQGFSLGWTFGITVALPLIQEALPQSSSFRRLDMWGKSVHISPMIRFGEVTEWRHGGWALLILLPFFLRIVAGLAGLAPEGSWLAARGHRRAPSLRQAWKSGRGLALSTCGLWIQIMLMMFAAALLFIGPTRLFFDLLELDGNGALGVLAAGVCIALVVFYGFVLTVLFQIALHSLVQNRRGVGSALLHAWRIAKNDPSSTIRATLVDAFLFAVVAVGLLLYVTLLSLVTPTLPKPLNMLLILPALMVESWTGCCRCYYWGRSYRALGGMSTRVDAPGP